MAIDHNTPSQPPASGGGGGQPARKAKSPRHRAREFAVQGLYQWQVGGQDIAAIQVQAESVAGFEKIDRKLTSNSSKRR